MPCPPLPARRMAIMERPFPCPPGSPGLIPAAPRGAARRCGDRRAPPAARWGPTPLCAPAAVRPWRCGASGPGSFPAPAPTHCIGRRTPRRPKTPLRKQNIPCLNPPPPKPLEAAVNPGEAQNHLEEGEAFVAQTCLAERLQRPRLVGNPAGHERGAGGGHQPAGIEGRLHAAKRRRRPPAAPPPRGRPPPPPPPP